MQLIVIMEFPMPRFHILTLLEVRKRSLQLRLVALHVEVHSDNIHEVSTAEMLGWLTSIS